MQARRLRVFFQMVFVQRFCAYVRFNVLCYVCYVSMLCSVPIVILYAFISEAELLP